MFNFNFENKIGNIQSEKQDIDPNGEGYMRISKLISVSEINHIKGINVPLYLEKGIFIKKTYGFSLLGGFNYHLIKYSKYNSTASVSYSGYYQQYFNIVLADNGIYDFGNYNISKVENLNTKSSFFSAQIGIGFYKVINNRVKLRLGVIHYENLTPIYNSNNLAISENINQLNNIAQSGIHLKMRASFLNLGFQIKF
jgi:hypothetical protein